MGEIEATSTATQGVVKISSALRETARTLPRCTNTLDALHKHPRRARRERSGASNMSRAPSLCVSMAGDLGTIQPFTRQSETVHDSGCRSIGLARGIAMAMTNTPGSEYRLWRGRALSHDAIQVVLRSKPPTRPISSAHRTCRSSRLRQGISRMYAHSSIDWALGALEFLRRGGPKDDQEGRARTPGLCWSCQSRWAGCRSPCRA